MNLSFRNLFLKKLTRERVDGDQLRGVTGTPTDTTAFGGTISGGVSIQVKRPNEARNLVTLCRNIERLYKSTDYQRHFAWIDNSRDPGSRSQGRKLLSPARHSHLRLPPVAAFSATVILALARGQFRTDSDS